MGDMSHYGTLRSARSSLCGRVFRFAKYNEGFPTSQKKGTLFWHSAHPGCKFVWCDDMIIYDILCDVRLIHYLSDFKCVLSNRSEMFWNKSQLISSETFMKFHAIVYLIFLILPCFDLQFVYFRRRVNPRFDDGGFSDLFRILQTLVDRRWYDIMFSWYFLVICLKLFISVLSCRCAGFPSHHLSSIIRYYT